MFVFDIYIFFSFLFNPDDKEEGVLGSLPLLSFKIGPVQALDNITRKFAFKVGDLFAFLINVLNAVGTRDGRGDR